jgi:hypothetical protein
LNGLNSFGKAVQQFELELRLPLGSAITSRKVAERKLLNKTKKLMEDF